MQESPCPDKQDIGSVQFQESPGPPNSQEEAYSLLASRRSANMDIDTGNVWSPSPKKSLLSSLEAVSPEMDTMNQPALKRQKTMSRKKKPEMASPFDSDQGNLI